jgi:hypothetical protein
MALQGSRSKGNRSAIRSQLFSRGKHARWAPHRDTGMYNTESTSVHNLDLADRLVRIINTYGVGHAARLLGTTIPTLDRVVCWGRGRPSTRRRLEERLPAVETGYIRDEHVLFCMEWAESADDCLTPYACKAIGPILLRMSLFDRMRLARGRFAKTTTKW